MWRAAGTLLFFVIAPSALGDTTLNSARTLYLTGRYEEANEQFEALANDHPVEAVLGVARCELSLGKHDDAQERLETAVERHGATAALHAQLAQLHYHQGRYKDAQAQCAKAVATNESEPLARWITAKLHRVRGEFDEAEAGYAWLVDYYNKTDDLDDVEALRVIGLAAAQQARWKRDSNQFRFLINGFYPDLLKREKNYWPAHLEMGRLFLEKYNQRDATRQFNAALAINPNSAEIHAARAELALQSYDLERAKTSIERALEVNPSYYPVLQLQADALMADFRVKEAIEILEQGRKLNPQSDETLGRLAAAFLYVDGMASADETDSRFARLVGEVEENNARCGEFYEVLGDAFDLLRKYPAAQRFYAESRRRMPQLIAVPGKLGMVQMRLGQEVQAKKLLDESFEADPFNVRVKNSLEVLDVLDTYAVIETEHFVIKFDRGQDQMLAEYSAAYLENEVYPQIVKDFGYEPKEKSLFEIFSRAKNTSGHGWFSARMVGLPSIGTVGACAGQMVAIASPNDMPQPYNWARVLKHEFVHVVNLQQTDFNIPHWFTEALAVRSEGYPRPPDWTKLLARRQAEDTLFTLDNINHGFLRPGAGDDWTLAYCQAEVYAEYMVKRFGQASLAKMLTAYRDNLSTAEAIQRCFDTSQEEFEAGYQKHVETIVAGVAGGDSSALKPLVELQKAAAEEPKNADVLAELSYAYLRRKANTDARRYALAALKIDEKQQLASYVLARLYLSIGDAKAALGYLQESFQEDDPQANHLALLGGILLKAKKYEQAERLFRLGAETFSQDEAWLKRLASIYLQSKDDAKLTEILERLVLLDTESVAFRTKLAQLAMDREEFEEAERWAMEALYVNIKNAPLHALRAEALAKNKRPAGAAKEYGYALQLDPDQLAWRLALAEAFAEVGKRDEAKTELDKVLRRSPAFPGAQELSNKLHDE